MKNPITASLDFNLRQAILGALFLSACSHLELPPENQLRQTLDTHITESGIKQFDYRIERIREPGMEGRNSRERFANGREKYKSPAARNREIKDYAHELLAKTMIEKGYCLRGYRLYDELIVADQYKARGECREGAGDLSTAQ